LNPYLFDRYYFNTYRDRMVVMYRSIKSLTTITKFSDFDFYLSGGSIDIIYVMMLSRDLR